MEIFVHSKVPEITGMFEFLQVLEEAIRCAEPDKRAKLAATIDAYSEDFPDEFYWAVSAQSPSLLCLMMGSIDIACRNVEKPRADSRIIPGKAQNSNLIRKRRSAMP